MKYLVGLLLSLQVATGEKGWVRREDLLVPFDQFQGEIFKIEKDFRSYRGLRLKNQLKVMLVSDPTLEISGGNMVVGSGTQDDGELLGMAHFCEHMLFLGNAKFPDQNELRDYFESNGGRVSASTGYNMTEYSFYAKSDALEEGLVRFANMFIHPLFNPDGVEREVNAVQSEYQYRAKNIHLKIQSVMFGVANASHPYTRFQCGSYDTLLLGAQRQGVQLHEKVREHFNKFYSASVMTFVLVSPFSLEKMQEMVVPWFSNIPNSNRASTNTGSPFHQEHLQKDVYMNPNMDTNYLILEFVIPIQDTFVQINVFDYIKYSFLQNENGSFKSIQKTKNDVEKVKIGFFDSFANVSLFQIEFRLAKVTQPLVEELTKEFFSYLKAFKDNGITWERYHQFQHIYRRNDDLFMESSGLYLASTLADVINEGIPMSHAVISLHHNSSFNYSQIREAADLLSPRVMRRIIVSPNCNGTLYEPWFNSNYTIFPMTNSLVQELQHLNTTLPLPELKTVINSEEISFESPEQLQLISNQTSYSLWHIRGPRISERKVLILAITDVKNYPTDIEDMHLKLLSNYLNEKLIASGQLSLLPGENVMFSVFNNKLVIQIDAFHIQRVLSKIFLVLISLEINHDGFDQEKNKYITQANQFKTKDLFSQSILLFMTATSWHSTSNYAPESLLARLTFEPFSNWLINFLSCYHINSLLVGHENSTSIIDLLTNYSKTSSNCSVSASPIKEIVISENNVFQSTSLDTDTSNSAIAFYLDLYHRESISDYAYTLSIENLISLNFFSQLRTNEQLGYVVVCLHFMREGGGGIMFAIQGTKNPIYLESRIESFIQNLTTTSLTNLTNATFQFKQQSLIKSREPKRPTLNYLANQYWPAIINQDLNFDRGNVKHFHGPSPNFINRKVNY